VIILIFSSFVLAATAARPSCGSVAAPSREGCTAWGRSGVEECIALAVMELPKKRKTKKEGRRKKGEFHNRTAKLQIADKPADDTLRGTARKCRCQGANGGSMSAEKAIEEVPLGNLERLQGHLKTGSLASTLVAARIAAGNADPRPVLWKAILDRIDALKIKHDPVSNQ
jgi:hypothetical protein